MESLILRRNYPVPVTFADLRQAAAIASIRPWPTTKWAEQVSGNVYPSMAQRTRIAWHAALKEATGATDDVYVRSGDREIHIGRIADQGEVRVDGERWQRAAIAHLLEVADEQGYWERPHEVRVDLQERITSKRAIDEVVQRSLIEAEVRRGH